MPSLFNFSTRNVLKSLLKRHFKTATVITQAQQIKHDEKETHFGFETVKESEKAQKGYLFIYHHNKLSV